MTLRIIQQTQYYEDQTRGFLQEQWRRMTLKIIHSWETVIACTASNIRHTIVRNRDQDDDADLDPEQQVFLDITYKDVIGI